MTDFRVQSEYSPDGAPSSADIPTSIRIRGARTHNLKNVDVDIPHNRMVVITGPSGSGKSSLAFDTLFAEGQRQYIESLSVYSRQFLDQMERPDVDSIEGLQPTICIDQRPGAPNPRSTVATVTEIYDFLRLLMARVGTPHCPDCGVAIRPQSAEQIQNQLIRLREGTRLMILAPIVRGKPGTHSEALAAIRKAGYVRVRVDGQIHDVESAPKLLPQTLHSVEAVIDRIVVRGGIETRVGDAVQLALKEAGGFVGAMYQNGAGTTDGEWQTEYFSTQCACPKCERQFEPLQPRSFSFNSPYGACPHCDGLGRRTEFDPELFVPDRGKSFAADACLPWKSFEDEQVSKHLADVKSFLESKKSSMDEPLETLSAHAWEQLMRGDGKKFIGLITMLEKELATATDSDRRDYLQLFRGDTICHACQGARLRTETLGVRFLDKNVDQICRLSIAEADGFFRRALEIISVDVGPIAQPIISQIVQRLSFLLKVGVHYLTLNRPAETLSGGELQRVRLATSVGTGLVGVCYILDEPSIGLHPRDNDRLILALRELQTQGNSVVIVEHDESIMRHADWLIDFGPNAGASGGEIVAQGRIEDLRGNSRSTTGRYLSTDGARVCRTQRARRAIGKNRAISIEGATLNNLQDVNARFPLGVFVCVSGVSGSGKSSLVNETLGPAMQRKLGAAAPKPGPFRSLRGTSGIQQVISVDQSPIGRSPRSNPATFTGVFDEIRKLFATTRDAKLRGFRAGRFSFNAKGGRCEACQGLGVQRIEMNFLPDLYVTCGECGGTRFNRQTLQVKFHGRSIADVLNMPVEEALPFFAGFSDILRPLQCLADVGLGYMPLGQPANTVSGGEAQRIKLAAQLARDDSGSTLYLLDEPTTGLHFEDIERLLTVLHRLVDLGNTVIVIEHNLDVLCSADWLIDLGPDGGANGGQIVAEGPPESVAQVDGSLTGRYLRQVLTSNPS